jgi:hypothetical protein
VSLAERWAHLAAGIAPGESDAERRRLKRAFYGGAAAFYNEISEVPLDEAAAAGELGTPLLDDESYSALIDALTAELNEFAAAVKARRA